MLSLLAIPSYNPDLPATSPTRPATITVHERQVRGRLFPSFSITIIGYILPLPNFLLNRSASPPPSLPLPVLVAGFRCELNEAGSCQQETALFL